MENGISPAELVVRQGSDRALGHGPGEPCLQAPDHERESGRGLCLVDQFTSHNWGWRRVGPDKYVRATLNTLR